ncbi:MAG: YfhO family protein, partial [Gemmatimonadota bacterium]
RIFPILGAYEPNELMLYRLESVTGMQKFRLRWWDDLVGEDFSRLLRNINLWRLLDIEYVVSPQPVSAPGLEPVFEGAGRLVYRWSEETPRAWVVPEVVVPAADQTAESLILDPTFRPRETAILEPGATPPTLNADTSAEARIRWETHTPDQLALTVESAGAGLLVFAEIYHPYWSATVDGDPTPVYQVDVALRGIPVTAGSHRVEMQFRDPTMRYGAWGSGIGILLLIGLLAATWRGRHGRQASPAEGGDGEGESEQESA